MKINKNRLDEIIKEEIELFDRYPTSEVRNYLLSESVQKVDSFESKFKKFGTQRC